MRLPFLSSLFVFIIWLAYEIKKHRAIETKPLKDYMEREREADNTPAKPMDDLEFIDIPLEELPTDVMTEDPEIKSLLETLQGLKEQKVVNLTGYSNTDLKLKYGAPNISRLIFWDQNYTVLARTLQKWGKLLMEGEHPEEGARVLEYAVKTRTDVLNTYELLAKYYIEKGQPEKICNLREVAESLESLRKEQILSLLKKYTEEGINSVSV